MDDMELSPIINTGPLTPAGQAVYLCALPTGALITPDWTATLRNEAVKRHGFEKLRIAWTKKALQAAAIDPDGHTARMQWAAAAAWFVDGRP